jgi:hypothetical protein
VKLEHQRDPAYLRLRNGRPHALAAILEDGDTRELALAAGKGKWERALATARALGAAGIECRDSEGAILEVIPLDVATRDEERAAGVDGAPLGELERLLTLCGDFADRATGRQQELLSNVCDTAIQVMRAAADRAERSERALDKLLRAHERLLLSQSSGDGAEMNSTDMMAMMASMMGMGMKPPAQLTKGVVGNGKDDEETIPIPRSTVEKVQAFLAAHPEVEL